MELVMSSPSSVTAKPLVGVIMGSDSDWETLESACIILREFGVAYEARVISAHRTPDAMVDYAKDAKSRGIKVIIAGAGGAAHLPGMTASHTILPVLGVPVKSNALFGMDSLLSIVQMPAGIPVATLAIGQAGAKNAALLAIQILGLANSELQDRLQQRRDDEAKRIAAITLPM
jgi:5-(carboxyamino)imidazole ribonucleotide mutase